MEELKDAWGVTDAVPEPEDEDWRRVTGPGRAKLTCKWANARTVVMRNRMLLVGVG